MSLLRRNGSKSPGKSKSVTVPPDKLRWRLVTSVPATRTRVVFVWHGQRYEGEFFGASKDGLQWQLRFRVQSLIPNKMWLPLGEITKWAPADGS